jgi:hypothetical protein
MGQRLMQPRLRPGRQLGQDVLEVSPGIVPIEFGLFDQTNQLCCPFIGFWLTTNMQCLRQCLNAHKRNRADRILHRTTDHQDARTAVASSPSL